MLQNRLYFHLYFARIRTISNQSELVYIKHRDTKFRNCLSEKSLDAMPEEAIDLRSRVTDEEVLLHELLK